MWIRMSWTMGREVRSGGISHDRNYVSKVMCPVLLISCKSYVIF
jgi:hypothetical protein